jgi:Fe2+ transport system protein B
LKYDEQAPTPVSTVLHKIEMGSAPRIAIVGATSVGKSSLVNALFGSVISHVSLTADTTSEVVRVEFPSGLVIYDTPGVFGSEEFENITRMFLGLPQLDQMPVDGVAYKSTPQSPLIELQAENLREQAPIDTVLWVVDVHLPLKRHEKEVHRLFYLELEKMFPDRIVVAGTHLDEVLNKEGGTANLEAWSKLTDNQLVPVSTITQDGLSDLVTVLFRTLPENVSLAKLQEALLVERKLNRLSFVLAEASDLLARIVLMRGDQENDIKVLSMLLFALVCNHYSVDEATWMRYNGDSGKIANTVRQKGVRTSTETRSPQTAWEKVRAFFGAKFFRDVVRYDRVGVSGLEELLPQVYSVIYDLDEIATPLVIKREIVQMIHANKEFADQVQAQSREKLAALISSFLKDLLIPDSHG